MKIPKNKQQLIKITKGSAMIKQNIAKLLDTEMERKDFLKLVGLGAVAAVGVTQVLKTLTQTTEQPAARPAPAGYGTMPYGGVKDPRS